MGRQVSESEHNIAGDVRVGRPVKERTLSPELKLRRKQRIDRIGRVKGQSGQSKAASKSA